MKTEIKVPAMGESITEATVGEMIKKTGDVVTVDDEIMELETDKVNQVLYAPESGKMTINVNTGDVVTIGQVLGVIDSDVLPEQVEKPKEEKQLHVENPVENKKEVETPRIFKEAYVNELSAPVSKDVADKPKQEEVKQTQTPLQSQEEVKESVFTGVKREERKKMSRLREVISKKLVEVKQQTAMLTTFNEVDLSQVMELRHKYQKEFTQNNDVKLGFMSFFIKASVSALKEFPEINAYIDENEIVYRHYFDISVAVGTDKGLVVPVVRDCDRRSFASIEKEIGNLATKARSGHLKMDDLQGGGFTITNGGVYGSLLSTPILNPPQSAILGMHTIQKRPVVIDDQIVIRPMMYLALSYDHRIVDGKEAVSFLIHIKNCLEDPSRLLLDI